MSENNSSKTCMPCSAGASGLESREVQNALNQLKNKWAINELNHITLNLKFSNFQSALDVCNKIGALAESEGHHPDIQLGWGYLNIELWTHKANAITESDIIFAAKVDELLNKE